MEGGLDYYSIICGDETYDQFVSQVSLPKLTGF